MLRPADTETAATLAVCIPKHNQDQDPDHDHHLYPDQHILISLSLPNQTDQKLSSNLDHLNRNNDGLQYDDMNERNHLSSSNNNNIISFKNFPSTTKHVSIVNIPKCDYVRMSSYLLFLAYCICLYM
ncbi:unnamed protein product [Schistosoma margrebowiei]|uniref:Uncharacterized protein n=1 Tax=Schistosoma margrebowiei TaxID=48269 RepID=A0A183MAM8_9TREM|nr:unnamed protein product [Schistosoma margrebowiei]